MSPVCSRERHVLLLGLVLGLTASRLAAQEAIFAEPLLATTQPPEDLVAIDLDGDGDLDLAELHHDGMQLEILLAGPDGFTSHAGYALDAYVAGVVAADFNGDGRPDLAVAIWGGGFPGAGNVAIFLNLGGGDFAPQPAIPLEACLHIAVADLDGNGTQDLVVVRDGLLSLLLGTGTGAFAVSATYSVPSGRFVVTDANGDGHPDVALADTANKVDVMLGTGSGTLGPLTSFATGLNPMDIASADFDENGSMDLITADRNSDTLSLLLGTGNGSFPTHAAHLVGDQPLSLVVGDFDEDGHRDAVCLNVQAATLSLVTGDGHGHLATASTLVPGYAPFRVWSADGNGDGHADLIVLNVNQPGTFAQLTAAGWLYGDGAGGFACTTTFGLQVSASQVIAADFDEDGRSDLLMDLHASQLALARGNGDGTLGNTLAIGLIGTSSGMAVGDLDLDGHLDAVVSIYDKDKFQVELGNGDGTLTSGTTKSTGDFPGGIILADVNADGLPDVVTCNSNSDNISVVLSTGHGHLGTATFYATHDSPGPLAAADIDADGDLDLVVGCSDKTALPMLGSGTGSFVQGTAVPVAYGPRAIATADFEGDGHPDFAVLTPYGELDVLHGLGGGLFAKIPISSGDYALDLALVDADGDGQQDLAWTEGFGNSVGVRRGLADGSFGDATSYATGFFPRALDAGDFDSDGRPDLAVGCGDYGTSGSISIVPNTSPSAWAKLGPALAGSTGKPALYGTGTLADGSPNSLQLLGAKPLAPATLIAGLATALLPFKGGTLVPVPAWFVAVTTGPKGQLQLPFAMPAGVPVGSTFVLQAWIADPVAVHGFAASNGVIGTSP